MPTVDTGDRKIFYDVIDLRPPWAPPPETVILHHGLGTNSAIWSDWLATLTSQYRVVRFDMRGCGASAPLGPTSPWTLDSFVDDVIAVADAVAAPRFHLIGESFGGTVTLYTSVVQGARLLSATCISAPHRGGSIKVLKGWNTLLGTADGMRAWSQNMMEYRFRDGAVSPAAFAWFKAEQDKTDPAMVRGVSELVMKTDLTPFLVRVLGPVLLLAPDSSPFVESQLVAELHGLLTTSELQVFAGTRHGLAFSHARECAELFVEFTIRNGRRPAGAQ
jgi:pimeloyl-ACP methyl ester carboxylesterase